jgi:hypothetical protein
MHLYSKSTVKINFGKPVVSSSTHITKSCLTFNNSDLPKGVLKHWQGTYLPALYQYLGTLKNPWSLDHLLPEVQHIWNEVFPNCPQELDLAAEPIFSW